MADAGTAAPVAPAPAATPPAGEVKPTPKPGAPTPKPEAGAAPAPEGPRKVKFRDPHGKEHEVEENDLAAHYFRGRKAQDTLSKWQQEKAATEKQWKEKEARLERLKDKGELRKFLQELGHDPRKLGEEFVLEQIEEEKLSPEAKALKEERAKREELERKETERTQQEEQKQYEAKRAEEANRLGTMFADAMEEVGIPDTLAGIFYPGMARLYKAARTAAREEARAYMEQTGQQVDFRTLIPPASYFAEHLRNSLDELMERYAPGRPEKMAGLFKGYAQARPVEELEDLIGEREYEGRKLKYPEIVNQRYVKALLEKRKGTPGATQASVAGGGAAVAGGYELPGDVVRRMPADLQNLYYRMQTADRDEKPGIVRNFEATARKYGVQLPGR